MCKLEDVVKNRILMFVVASDRVKITNNLHQVISGFKVVDIAAMCLLAKRLVKPQTRNVCWPVRIVVGIKTEAMSTNCVNHVYDWWDDCNNSNENDERINNVCPVMRPFNTC